MRVRGGEQDLDVRGLNLAREGELLDVVPVLKRHLSGHHICGAAGVTLEAAHVEDLNGSCVAEVEVVVVLADAIASEPVSERLAIGLGEGLWVTSL